MNAREYKRRRLDQLLAAAREARAAELLELANQTPSPEEPIDWPAMQDGPLTEEQLQARRREYYRLRSPKYSTGD